jgi:hypothetical protein
MNHRTAFLSAALAVGLMFAEGNARAASGADLSAPSSSVAAVAPRLWMVRAEGSLVEMRDNWLGLPGPEVGVTVGRDLERRVSVELTGNMREPNSGRRSWSALAAVRLVAVASARGRHALTVAAGPFLEIANVVHGTLPFAYAEIAYVYRAPFGLTVLVGGGPNIALASSSYVTPPSQCSTNGGDSVTFCGLSGPDAQEMHAGDANVHLRLAVGWQF